MSNYDFLQNIKPGYKVIVSYGGFHNLRKVEPVIKVTKTQIIVPTGRFRKKNGWLVGRGVWNTTSISEATPEAIAEITAENEYRQVLSKILDVKWREVEPDKLKKILEILED